MSSLFEDVFESSPTPSASPAPPASVSARKRRVLVVGGEELLRAQIKGLLESDGYQVMVFENGREARDALSSTHFDLVISDVYMPGGDIQGHQLLDWVRKKSAARFVMLSGNKSRKPGEPQDLSSPDAYERPGVPLPDRLLVKPFKPSELRRAVSSCFAPTKGQRQILTLSRPEQGSLREVTLDPDQLAALPRQELLIEAGHGAFELLCAAQDPLPISKIRSLQRLGIRLWSRAS